MVGLGRVLWTTMLCAFVVLGFDSPNLAVHQGVCSSYNEAGLA